MELCNSRIPNSGPGLIVFLIFLAAFAPPQPIFGQIVGDQTVSPDSKSGAPAPAILNNAPETPAPAIPNNQQAATHKHNINDSILHVLITGTHTGTLPADADPDDFVIPDLSKPLQVPFIEIIKLKTSAKNAGLDDAKAERVSRAAVALNMTYSDVADLRKLFNNPATSAEYAEKVHRALDAAVEEEIAKNGGQIDNTAGADDLLEANLQYKRSISDNEIGTVAANIMSKVDSTLFHAKRYCGFSPKLDSTPYRLSNAHPGQFPWSAAILSEHDEFLCAGSLISDKLVLTTASCIVTYKQNNQALKVVLGAWSLPDGHRYLPELRVFIRAAAIHPNYVASNAQAAAHDVGILELYDSVDFDLYPHIFPVCVIGPKHESFAVTTNCRVLGWPEMPHMEPWRSSSYLAWGDVQINANGCGQNPITPCATGHCCVGNGGSPIVCLANSERYYQWGIVGVEPHCDRNSPAAAVQIVSVLQNYDFIAKHMHL